MIEEFAGYLAIDKDALDVELQHQSELLYKIGEAFVDAVAMRDLRKEQLATTDADLDAYIRNSEDKLTEPAIKNAIQAHKKHKAAQIAYFDAKAVADKLGVLKDAMKDRGFMLRALCELYISNYYEDTSVKGTNRTDTAAYHQQRKRLSDRRDLRDQERG